MTENTPQSDFEEDLNLPSPEKPVKVGLTLTKKEKTFLGVFIFLGLIIILLSFLQFKKDINISVADFLQMSGLDKTQEKLPTDTAVTVDDGTDTDKDGLTDYEELNVYKTSPYLEDSDSDGVTDKQEIVTGQNPNCPKGQLCGFDQTNEGNMANLQPNVTAQDSGDDQKLLSGQMSVAELREYLLSQGAPADILQNISDEDLLTVYGQALSSGALSSNNTAPSAGTDQFDFGSLTAEQIEQLKNLDADSIRQFMIQNGADINLVNQYTDEQVKALYQEALTKILNDKK